MKELSMKNENVKLASPWVIYWKEIKAMFGEDPDIELSFDEARCKISMFVTNVQKAEALEYLLPEEVQFGNVTLYIEVIPANIKLSKADYLERALTGNPNFSRRISIENELIPGAFQYFMFKKKIAQYPIDDLTDPNGIKSILYQDLAKKLFAVEPGVFFATEKN